MQLAPLPHELGWMGPPDLTHEQWWALTPDKQRERIRLLRSISPKLAHDPAVYPFVFYEAQQPPLYYWIMSIPMRLVKWRPIASRVLFIRLISILLVSLVIPLTWFAAKGVLGGDLAVYAAAILAVAPGLMIDVARVANDGLTLPLVALLILLMLRSKPPWAAVGLVLGAGLLTKGNLLALLPAAGICWIRAEWRKLILAYLLAIAVAGWWYWRNLVSGHSFTGWMNEVAFVSLLAAVPRINWPAAAQVSAKSFLWFGAWSFLTLKSWIYIVLEAVGMIAALGCMRAQLKTLRVPITFAVCFGAAMVYATLGIYGTAGVANAPGWYLWAAACPLAILFTTGAQRLTIILIAAFALIDLYGANGVMMPYYAGLVTRNHVDLSKVPEALTRLNVTWALWVGYVAATVSIPFLVYGRRYTRT